MHSKFSVMLSIIKKGTTHPNSAKELRRCQRFHKFWKVHLSAGIVVGFSGSMINKIHTSGKRFLHYFLRICSTGKIHALLYKYNRLKIN